VCVCEWSIETKEGKIEEEEHRVFVWAVVEYENELHRGSGASVVVVAAKEAEAEYSEKKFCYCRHQHTLVQTVF